MAEGRVIAFFALTPAERRAKVNAARERIRKAEQQRRADRHEQQMAKAAEMRPTRPTCPTCGGTRFSEQQLDRPYTALVGGPCPDCFDGRVPMGKFLVPSPGSICRKERA